MAFDKAYEAMKLRGSQGFKGGKTGKDGTHGGRV